MNVAQYTFQSPSTSQVQVGRLDSSSVKEEKNQTTQTDTKETQHTVNPAMKAERLLDIYA